MLTGLMNPEACFLFGIIAFFIKHKGYNDLQRAAEGGHDAAAYLYAILLYIDNGGAAADDAVKGYMRQVAGTGNGSGCVVEKGWLQIPLFCNEDCRLRCEMVKFTQRIGIGNQ
jgi:TPR repeat protein